MKRRVEVSDFSDSNKKSKANVSETDLRTAVCFKIFSMDYNNAVEIDELLEQLRKNNLIDEQLIHSVLDKEIMNGMKLEDTTDSFEDYFKKNPIYSILSVFFECMENGININAVNRESNQSFIHHLYNFAEKASVYPGLWDEFYAIVAPKKDNPCPEKYTHFVMDEPFWNVIKASKDWVTLGAILKNKSYPVEISANFYDYFEKNYPKNEKDYKKVMNCAQNKISIKKEAITEVANKFMLFATDVKPNFTPETETNKLNMEHK